MALIHVAKLCGWSFVACSSALIIVAAIDAPFQLWQHNKQLKMTKQEIRDENKETEGRPEVKGRIRALQHELSRRRMMEAVPTADVIITNPTHYAVALSYDPSRMKAPVVVAKGADLIAANIRAVADKHHVAIVSAPPLARALYASTELDQEIPGGLYVAVATILTYVYQLRATAAAGEMPPETPHDLPIPDELIDVLKHDDSNE
jgi:flagellar biosynthetic protein FlhB